MHPAVQSSQGGHSAHELFSLTARRLPADVSGLVRNGSREPLDYYAVFPEVHVPALFVQPLVSPFPLGQHALPLSPFLWFLARACLSPYLYLPEIQCASAVAEVFEKCLVANILVLVHQVGGFAGLMWSPDLKMSVAAQTDSVTLEQLESNWKALGDYDPKFD